MSQREGLFSKRRWEAFREFLWNQNPISFQILGICSALATTTQVKTAMIMILGLAFVTSLSSTIISLLRKYIPSAIRIIIFLVVIATLVIIVDEVLKAFMFDLSKKLSVYVGLIITNCIVMGRAEAFAMSNGPWDSFLDGISNSLGYGFFLLAIAVPRELLGNGTILGFRLIPESAYDMGYKNAGIMLLAPSAFIILGLLIWGKTEMDMRAAKKGGR